MDLDFTSTKQEHQTDSISSSTNSNSVANVESAVHPPPISSPKIPVYTNLGTNVQTPSNSGPGRKKLASRSATPSSSGTILQLKVDSAAKFAPSSNDVYEFHSSPEESNAPSSIGFFASSPLASSITLQQKSASSSSIQSMIDAPPHKRIKTAILAKKLLAAAADSNIIDSTDLPISQNQKKGEKQTADKQREDVEDEEGVVDEDDEDEVDERGIEEEEVEEEQKEDEKSSSSTSVLVQEQKKVPPLRISLLKTPSEEGNEGSAQVSTFSRRRGGRIGGAGRRQGYGSKKDEQQRLTRSRIRQIANPEAEDSPVGRKRRHRGGTGAESVGILEEEDTLRSAADALEEKSYRSEVRKSDEAAQQSAADLAKNAAAEKAQKQLSAAITIFSKNSLEQSVGFETMVLEKWTNQYKSHLELVAEKLEGTSLQHVYELKPEPNAFNSIEPVSKSKWPLSLQKLHSEQEKRRRELFEEHRLDRERIQEMAKREVARAEERQRASKAGSEQQRSRGFLTIVSLLRDSECYDPALFVGDEHAQGTIHPSLQEMRKRYNYLSRTAKNRHTMEAHTLLETQKSEWLRATRKAQRQNEQQLILKGVCRNQQQQQHLLPAECNAIELMVSAVPVVEVQLPPFHINVQ